MFDLKGPYDKRNAHAIVADVMWSASPRDVRRMSASGSKAGERADPISSISNNWLRTKVTRYI